VINDGRWLQRPRGASTGSLARLPGCYQGPWWDMGRFTPPIRETPKDLGLLGSKSPLMIAPPLCCDGDRLLIPSSHIYLLSEIPPECRPRGRTGPHQMTLPSYLGLWWMLTAPRMLRLVMHELLISTAAPRLHRQRLKVHICVRPMEKITAGSSPDPWRCRHLPPKVSCSRCLGSTSEGLRARVSVALSPTGQVETLSPGDQLQGGKAEMQIRPVGSRSWHADAHLSPASDSVVKHSLEGDSLAGSIYHSRITALVAEGRRCKSYPHTTEQRDARIALQASKLASCRNGAACDSHTAETRGGTYQAIHMRVAAIGPNEISIPTPTTGQS